MRELVVQYEPSARETVAAAYRDFLGALDPDVTVHVVCPDRAAYEDFMSLAGSVRCRLEPILTHHPITSWARDRWVALTPSSPAGATTLWSPRGENANEVWPARAGDERVGQDIATALGPAARAVRSGLYFDGGDFLSDSDNVFVSPRVLQRNLQHTVDGREEFLRAIANAVKRRVILLDESPDHHAGMFMASVGGHIMLVGDPRLGRSLLPAQFQAEDPAANRDFMNLPGGPDFTAATQHLFDAVAGQCAAAGYRVVRIPVVPAQDGRTYLTYVNVLLDRAGDRRIVYLPYYRGAEALNAAARALWEELGFEVRLVDCTATYRYFGCLHCLVNVLKRS
jgi:8-oxo-dGTP pyrophosphatase MutT (NUDIX family)